MSGRHAKGDHVYHYKHGWIPIDGTGRKDETRDSLHEQGAALEAMYGGHSSSAQKIASRATGKPSPAKNTAPTRSADKIAERATGKPATHVVTARSADRVAAQALPAHAITEDQRYALKVYTSSAYGPINNALRANRPVPANLAPQVAHMDAALAAHPLQHPLTTRRTIGLDAFGIDWKFGHGLTGDPATLKGKTFHDAGFMSTRADMKRDGDDPAMIALTFEVPPGVGAVDVSRFSNAPAEKEIVLQRGLSYQITNVSRDADGLWSGTARVLR